MSTEERLSQLNRAARSIALIEAWHLVSDSSDLWKALVAEAREELHPSPGSPLGAALTAALTAVIAEIAAAEAAPRPNEGEAK